MTRPLRCGNWHARAKHGGGSTRSLADRVLLRGHGDTSIRLLCKQFCFMARNHGLCQNPPYVIFAASIPGWRVISLRDISVAWRMELGFTLRQRRYSRRLVYERSTSTSKSGGTLLGLESWQDQFIGSADGVQLYLVNPGKWFGGG